MVTGLGPFPWDTKLLLTASSSCCFDITFLPAETKLLSNSLIMDTSFCCSPFAVVTSICQVPVRLESGLPEDCLPLRSNHRQCAAWGVRSGARKPYSILP